MKCDKHQCQECPNAGCECDDLPFEMTDLRGRPIKLEDEDEYGEARRREQKWRRRKSVFLEDGEI
jgi:hypothetical protein